ncbi:hypothetical protein FOZ63_011127, partial [Perkinsus olseni]
AAEERVLDGLLNAPRKPEWWRFEERAAVVNTSSKSPTISGILGNRRLRDSATCSLSLTYSVGEADTKVIVGAMMRRGNKDTEENEELHGELTYVSVAKETPSRSAPQKECSINHYFDFRGLDDHFSKSWKPSSKYGGKATERGCKAYIKALGNDIAGRTEMDGWKEVIVTETAEKKKRGLFKAFSKDAKLNKAIFAIGLETAVRNRALKRNSQKAIAKSTNDPNVGNPEQGNA